MSRRMRVTDLASILGASASIIGLGWALVAVIGIKPDILISLASALVAFVVGWWSKQIADRAARVAGRRRVFLSYSHANRELADQIAHALRATGAHVWLDYERIQPGDDIRSAVSRGIDASDAFVAIVSKQMSPGLSAELSLAKERGVRLIPVLVEDVQLPSDLAGIQYVDLRTDRDRGLAAIVQASTGSAG